MYSENKTKSDFLELRNSYSKLVETIDDILRLEMKSYTDNVDEELELACTKYVMYTMRLIELIG